MAHRLQSSLGALTLGALLAPAAGAQVSFSIDWHSPTKGQPDSFTNSPITEGDLLGPVTGIPALGPLATPGTLIPAGAGGLGLPGSPLCNVTGAPCKVEVDAMSYGDDRLFGPNSTTPAGRLWFSVDEYARGLPFVPIGGPSVSTEGSVGDAAADLFVSRAPLPPGPLAPPAVPKGNVGAIDGNGLASLSGARYPGLGLIEPHLPSNTTPPDSGDNVDAFDIEGPAIGAVQRVYFSLDANYVDPLNGVPHSGSALTLGGSGADVWTVPSPAFVPTLYAGAQQLGLDLGILVGDDLDALILLENGDNVFQPSQQPYDWMNGSTDMLLFSVRRGSSVIGLPDSIFGIPIEEGDILTTPLTNSSGGVSPFPGIFVAAEWLGLRTKRGGFTGFADDLNALDGLKNAFFDCNDNQIEDAVDIATGSSNDFNLNGIPDECEALVSPYCFCANVAPCGNLDPLAGCRNSTGNGARATWQGTTSVSQDDLVLRAVSVPTNVFGLVFMGSQQTAPTFLFDGLLCTGGTTFRFPLKSSGNAGQIVEGPGIVAHSATFGLAGTIQAGDTWNFQTWFRDPIGPCLLTANLSNALAVTFVP